MSKGFLGSQLRINMVSGVATTVVNVAVIAVSYPVYLHYLGYEKYGVWLILATILSFIQMGGNLGVEPAVTKLVAEEYGRRNFPGIKSYVTMALATLCCSGFLGLIVILCLKSQIVAVFKLGGDNAKLALSLLPYIGILCIYAFIVRVFNATLSGLGRMDIANYNQSTGRVVVVVVAVSLLYRGAGLESLLIGNAVSYFVIHIISLFFIRKMMQCQFLSLHNWDFQRFKKLLRFGSGIVGGSAMNVLLSPFNKLMLSRYVGASSIPVYDIVYSGSMQVRALMDVGLRALMPEISRAATDTAGQGRKRILSIYRRCFKMVFFGGTPIFAFGILVIAYTPVLKLWLGDKFVNELPPAACIMLAATLLSLLGVPAYYTLMGLGRVRLIVFSHLIQSVLNVVLVVAIAISVIPLSVSKVALITAVAMGCSTAYLVWQKRTAILHV